MKKHILRAVCIMQVLVILISLTSCFDGRGSLLDEPAWDEISAPEYDRIAILSNGIKLSLSDDGIGYVVESGLGCTAESVTVPSVYNGRLVTEIATFAFKDNTHVKNIILPESILRINRGAFDGCTALEYNEYGNAKYLGTASNPHAFLISSVSADISSVDISKTARIIAYGAFRDHSNLTSVRLPDSVRRIGEEAFIGCRALKDFDFGGGVEYIGKSAFSNTSIESVRLPDSVLRVDEFSFSNTGIKDLRLGNSIEYIGRQAFSGIETDVLELPDSLTELGTGAFSGATIKRLVIGDGLKKIEIGCFAGCTLLEEIEFGNSLEYISQMAFSRCLSLKKVELPRSLKAVDPSAFEKCVGLIYNEYKDMSYLGDGESKFAFLMLMPQNYDGNLVLHPDVRLIARAVDDFGGGDAIYETNTVTMDGEGKHLRVVDNCVIDPKTKTLVFGTNESLIPNDGSVTSIGDYAFFLRRTLGDVTLPDGLVSVGDCAFYGCDGTQTVKFNADLERIGDRAFSGMYGLVNAELPEGLKYLGERAFADCMKLSSIYIPGSVEEIGINAFSCCYAAERIVIGEGVTRLGDVAFDCCKSVTEVVLPSTLKYIDKGAFRQLYSLQKIEFPEGLLYIGDYAFQHCPKLTELTMPESLLGIGMKAFDYCGDFGVVNLNSGLREIGDDAFRGISDATRVNYAGTVEDWEKIENCDNLVRGKNDMRVVCIDGEALLSPAPAVSESVFD